jgi:hypothetical protein
MFGEGIFGAGTGRLVTARTLRAETGYFDGLTNDLKARVIRSLFDKFLNRGIIKLSNRAAFPAYQKLSAVLAQRAAATNVGIQGFDAVHETLIAEKIERPINRWRRGAAACLPQPVKEIVGANRAMLRPDHFKDLPAQFG